MCRDQQGFWNGSSWCCGGLGQVRPKESQGWDSHRQTSYGFTKIPSAPNGEESMCRLGNRHGLGSVTEQISGGGIREMGEEPILKSAD